MKKTAAQTLPVNKLQSAALEENLSFSTKSRALTIPGFSSVHVVERQQKNGCADALEYGQIC